MSDDLQTELDGTSRVSSGQPQVRRTHHRVEVSWEQTPAPWSLQWVCVCVWVWVWVSNVRLFDILTMLTYTESICHEVPFLPREIEV